MSDIAGEKVLDLANGGAYVSRATDPVLQPATYASPADFAAQYPTPLDTTEIMTLCEDITALQNIPDISTALKEHTWREMTSLAFTSGSAYIAFADGACPEEYTHNGSNTTVTLKNIGAKKTLSLSDIRHSMAIASANWGGINTLVGGYPGGEGLPGAADFATFQRETVRDVKEKELRLATTLVMNGWDRLLILGNSVTNSLEFDGIENWSVNMACTMHTGSAAAMSGTFSATSFDQWLSESCAKPTHLFGHPSAIQELMSAYFQLGYQGSQNVNFAGPGSRITPGYNFSGFVNTGIGQLTVVADSNFTKTAVGTTYQASIWALRMTHNGEPLVFRISQFPLGYQDLAPGCTAVAFEIWAKTALVIKACCAQGKYTATFTGRVVTTCTRIG